MRDRGTGTAVAIVIIIIAVGAVGGYIALSRDISFSDEPRSPEGGGLGGGTVSDESKPPDSGGLSEGTGNFHPAVEYAKMIPKNVEIFTVVSGEFIETGAEHIPDYLHINPEDVKFGASGVGVTIYEGSFDSDAITGKLEDLSYEDDDYKGVEVWKDEQGNGWVALVEDKIVDGEESKVRNCIEVVKGEMESFYSNEDVTILLDELEYVDRVEITVTSGQYFEGVEALGSSWKMLDNEAEKLDLQGLFLFENGDMAEDSMGAIENSLGTVQYEDLDVSRSGKMVKVTVKGLELPSPTHSQAKEESVSPSQAKRSWEGSIDIKNASAGSTGLMIRHMGGDPAMDALYCDGKNFYWNNLEVFINGAPVDSTEISGVISEGVSVTTEGYYRLIAGDRVELDLNSPLEVKDEVFVLWAPTGQIVLESKILS